MSDWDLNGRDRGIPSVFRDVHAPADMAATRNPTQNWTAQQLRNSSAHQCSAVSITTTAGLRDAS